MNFYDTIMYDRNAMFILYLLKSLSSFTDYKITRASIGNHKKTGKGRHRKNTGIVL